MMESEHATFNIMFEQLNSLLRTEAVVGKPIQLGDITLVPVINASFIIVNPLNRCAGGLGCSISPLAMIMIKGNEVKLLYISEKGSLERVLKSIADIIPDIMAEMSHSSSAKRGS